MLRAFTVSLRGRVDRLDVSESLQLAAEGVEGISNLLRGELEKITAGVDGFHDRIMEVFSKPLVFNGKPIEIVSNDADGNTITLSVQAVSLPGCVDPSGLVPNPEKRD